MKALTADRIGVRNTESESVKSILSEATHFFNMAFVLSNNSPLRNWTNNSDDLNDGNYEWEHEDDDVLIRVLSSEDGRIWQVDLFDTSTDRPSVAMDHTWKDREVVHHPNIARAVAEEYANNYQEFLN